METWAQGIAQEQGFTITSCDSVQTYYSSDVIRRMIFLGQFEGAEAQLCVYDDPRICDEAAAIKLFLSHNTSDVISTYEVLAHGDASDHRGWFVLEHSSDLENAFSSPLGDDQRSDFLKLFAEYRSHFPFTPTRALRLDEYLPAHEFHAYRLARWYLLAAQKQETEEKRVLDPSDVAPRYARAMNLIRSVFSERKMIWCHGHVKPSNFFYNSQDKKYYLTDFAHTRMYPEGYELAFIIWADVLMDGDYSQEYTQWREQIDQWIHLLEPFAKESSPELYDELIRASLVERVLGTILADIGASDMAYTEKTHRLSYLYRFLDQLLDA